MKNLFSLSLIFCIAFILNTAHSQIVWQQLQGPYGGSVNKIKKGYGNDVIALTSSFAYKSTDMGINWNRINNGVFFPLDLFFFNGKVFGISQSGTSSENFLYISTDTMKTWTKKSSGLENQIIQKIRLIGTEFYACTNKGVYKSTNYGDSWTKAFEITGIKYTPIYDIRFNSKGMIFLATISGLYRSTNNGTTWQLMNPDNENMESNIENLVIDSEDKIFLNTPLGMFRSYDDGNIWTQMGEGTMDGNLGFLLNPFKGKLIAGKLWGGIYISLDFGDTWTKVNDNSLRDMIITEDGKYLGGAINGIYYADSLTSTWIPRNQGINETIVTSIFAIKTDIAHKDDIIAGSGSGCIYKSSDAGKTWKPVFQSQGSMITKIIAGKNDWLFASSVWGGVARSSDFGDTWEDANNGLNDADIKALAVDKNGNLYAGAFSVVYKSTDNGSNWTVCLTLSQSIQCSSLAVNDKNVIFAATMVYGVLSSTNYGETWNQMANGLAMPVPYLTLNKSNHVYATANNGNLYKSTNDGSEWTLVKDSIFIVNMFFVNDNNIFAAVDQNHEVVGILRSKDQGLTWAGEQTGIENIFVYSFDSNTNGEILAGSGYGIFKTNRSIVSVKEDIHTLNDFYVFPNPASDFINTSNFPGEIKIFDLMGKEIININTKVTNSNKQMIDISGLKPGLYFIKSGNNFCKFVKI